MCRQTGYFYCGSSWWRPATVVPSPLIDLLSSSLFKALTYTRKKQHIEATENGWDDTVRTVAVESGNEILCCTGNYVEKETGRGIVSIEDSQFYGPFLNH